MHIMITGAHGQLGSELVRCLSSGAAEIGPIPEPYAGATWDAIDRDTLDISDEVAVRDWFASHRYDLVINCAAMTNVDGCESEEKSAYRVNALGPCYLARACAAQGAKFMHVSTDYVFPGNVPGSRVETDLVGPLSAYGRTKLVGELFALAENPRTFVCRTAWLYGYVGKNFVKTMRRLGATRERITVVDDQLGNPTSANDLAYEMLKVALTDEYGLYHMTNNGTVSWAAFASAIMAGSGLTCEVVPITSAEYRAANPQSASRPRFSSLENRHLAETVGDEMRPWSVALADFLSRLPELEA